MKKPPSDSPFPNYLGNAAFPNEQPVCKPIVSGRTIKPLEGPVHPGFKGKPKPATKIAPPSHLITRSSQNDDLYQRLPKKMNKRRP